MARRQNALRPRRSIGPMVHAPPDVAGPADFWASCIKLSVPRRGRLAAVVACAGVLIFGLAKAEMRGAPRRGSSTSRGGRSRSGSGRSSNGRSEPRRRPGWTGLDSPDTSNAKRAGRNTTTASRVGRTSRVAASTRKTKTLATNRRIGDLGGTRRHHGHAAWPDVDVGRPDRLRPRGFG